MDAQATGINCCAILCCAVLRAGKICSPPGVNDYIDYGAHGDYEDDDSRPSGVPALVQPSMAATVSLDGRQGLDAQMPKSGRFSSDVEGGAAQEENARMVSPQSTQRRMLVKELAKSKREYPVHPCRGGCWPCRWFMCVACTALLWSAGASLAAGAWRSCSAVAGCCRICAPSAPTQLQTSRPSPGPSLRAASPHTR
jgi:hypothetical protein